MTRRDHPSRTPKRVPRRRLHRWLVDRLGSERAASAVEWTLIIAGSLAVAFVVRAVVFQSFFIPSQSMYPTLDTGDRVLVEKVSRHLGSPGHGDVIVFTNPDPESDDVHLIKRVVALAGESVAFDAGRVYVGGKPLDEPYLPAGTMTGPARATAYACTLENPCDVPDGHVWVMGDNRPGSRDSRYFGPVAIDTVVGRAVVVFWPLGRLSGL